VVRSPPETYREALAWLTELGGTAVFDEEDDGTITVTVGLLGRSAQGSTSLLNPRDTEGAFLEAIWLLAKRL
jgi:hypothetical protein